MFEYNDKYHQLRSLIKQWADGDVNCTEEDILDDLDRCLGEGLITGREYDNLLCLF